MNAAIVRAVHGLEKNIEDLNSRIKALEAYTEPATPGTNSASSLENVLKNLMRLHSERLHLRAQKEVVWAFGKVLQATPARSGYARSGWTLTTGERPPVPPAFTDNANDNSSSSDAYHADRVEAAVSEALARLPENLLAPLFVSNAVPYMALLEAGLSDQAPAGFVAAAVENLRARLELLAREDRP